MTGTKLFFLLIGNVLLFIACIPYMKLDSARKHECRELHERIDCSEGRQRQLRARIRELEERIETLEASK